MNQKTEQETALLAFKDIPRDLLWRDAAREQIDQLGKFVKIGTSWRVVGYHRSKSIRLPVVEVMYEGLRVLVRDNFYGVNVCVVSETPIQLTYLELFSGVLEARDWSWYLDQIHRCAGYSWRGWSLEAQNDPSLPSDADPDPGPERRARWAARLTDPSWYQHDWSHDPISYDGEFGPSATLWVQPHAFLEGIAGTGLVPESATRPYTPGCSGFALGLFHLNAVESLLTQLARRPR